MLYLLSMYLGWSVWANLLPIKKNWNVYFLIIEVWEYFIYSGYKPFIRYVVCNCFLQVCGLSFHSVNLHTLISYMASLIYYTYFVHHGCHAVTGWCHRKTSGIAEWICPRQVQRGGLREAEFELVIQSHFLCQKKRDVAAVLFLISI